MENLARRNRKLQIILYGGSFSTRHIYNRTEHSRGFFICFMIRKLVIFPPGIRVTFKTYMLFAGREVRIGKNCARGLGYGPMPQPEGRAQDRGHSFFSNTDRPNVFIFFSLENYFIRNICVDFSLKQFHTVRVRLTFRSSKPVLFTKYLKEDIQFSLILELIMSNEGLHFMEIFSVTKLLK